MEYRAPLAHVRFLIERVCGLPALRELPAFAEVSAGLVESVLESAARFAGEVLAPLAAVGDCTGARIEAGRVLAPPGFAAAYRRFAADGWTSLTAPPEHGGQGLPQLLGAAASEMWSGANLAFALCPELALGAIEALERHAAPELRARFLPRIVSGEWTATMCLTEPQAGSDLSVLQTRAERAGDAWRLRGRKIFITWGDHDLADNIVHLVLARAEGAPEGLRGISLFLVPKRRVAADGTPEGPNDLAAVSIEHKMGIHGSPTCVIALGDRAGAEGHLVGELDSGLACMFTMMNHMRLGVGIQAVGVAERAFQLASRHARERIQGRDAAGRRTAIIGHADVRRMLLTMKALLWAARSLAFTAAAALDRARHGGTPEERARALARAELLTPLVKAWASEVAQEIASLGIQIHGGMGYVEETGAAQCYRDVRITAIYEGTNGIQAHDLLGRKVLRDGGAALADLLAEMHAAADALSAGEPRARELRRRCRDARARLAADRRGGRARFPAAARRGGRRMAVGARGARRARRRRVRRALPCGSRYGGLLRRSRPAARTRARAGGAGRRRGRARRRPRVHLSVARLARSRRREVVKSFA